MIKRVINPDGSQILRGGHLPSHEAYTGAQVKQALEAFVIDFFFEKKGGEMTVPTVFEYPQVISEDAACDLVKEFWDEYESSDYKLLADGGFFKCREAYVGSTGVELAKFGNKWRVRSSCNSRWYYFSETKDAVEEAKRLERIG